MKQYFQKRKLKFIEETTELQKKQTWIKANTLILNSSLAFNPQMREITGQSWILTKSQSEIAVESIIEPSKVVHSRGKPSKRVHGRRK